MASAEVSPKPSAEPGYFTFGLRLSAFDFPRGVVSAFATAPGGAFGRVLVGSARASGMPMAVKVLMTKGTSREKFHAEAEMLLHLRGKIDTVKELAARGIELSLADCGARHLAYVYGTGEEANLANVDAGLPNEPAFLIAVDPHPTSLSSALLNREGPAPPFLSLARAAHEVALALAFMAQHRLVHSDVKPDNVMLAADGRCVLGDLGMGRLAPPPGESVYAGHDGTLVYIAPELLEKRSRSPTHASDIYAYGLLLWCLFSGRRNAWVGPTGALPTDQGLMGVLSGVLRGERPPLSALREGTPQAIVALITRCWAHDPADRPSALEVAVETQAWLAGTLQAPRPPSSRHSLQSLTGRRGETRSLRSILDDGSSRLDNRLLLTWVAEIASALESLHRAGVVHGSLKAAAVRIGLTTNEVVSIGDPRLLDATSEAAFSGLTGTTSSGTASSAMRWNAPELQFDPDVRILAIESPAPTFESDVWAFGVTAWEVLTQRVPFDVTRCDPLASLPSDRIQALRGVSSSHRHMRFGATQLESFADVARRILCGETPASHAGWPDGVPRDVVDILSRCCLPTATERPRMVDVAETLRCVIAASGPAAPSERPPDVADSRGAVDDALLERLTAASKSTVGAVWTYAEAGNTAGVRAALAAGGSTEEADEGGVTAVAIAAARGHVDVVRCLVEAGARVMAPDKSGSTALHWAASKGRVAVAACILSDATIDSDARRADGSAPIHDAAMWDYEAIVSLLLAHPRVKPSARKASGTTPLIEAARNNAAAAVSRLLADPRVDPNESSKGGFCALHGAAYYGYTAVVRILLADARVDVNAEDDGKRTALQWARTVRKTEMVALLESDTRVSR